VDPLVRTFGGEIGARTKLADNFTGTLAAWWIESDSELVYIGDAGTNEAGPGSRRYGVEGTLAWKPKSWLTLDAEVALTKARFTESPGADRIPDSVPWMANAGVTIGEERGFYGTLRARAFGRRPLIEDNSVKGRETFTMNAVVGYRTDRWEAAVECLNLLDREDNDIEYFYPSRLPGEDLAGFDDIHVHPAEPRMFRARFTVKW
jgi:outer membrane receptor protein involved in Fe transport